MGFRDPRPSAMLPFWSWSAPDCPSSGLFSVRLPWLLQPGTLRIKKPTYQHRLVYRQSRARPLPAQRDHEAQQLEAQQLAAQRLEAQKLAARQLEAQQLEAQKLAAQQLEAQQLEAQELAAQQLEAQQLELEAQRHPAVAGCSRAVTPASR